MQTLPDFFDLDTRKGRGVWATVIGNAVPPLFIVHLLAPLLDALPSPAVQETQLVGLTPHEPPVPLALIGDSVS